MANVTSYSKVTSSYYNTTFVTGINNLLGPTTNGYGQTISVSNVATYAKITAAQWAAVKSDLLKIATHQGLSQNAGWTAGTLTSIPTLPTITSYTKITATDVNAFDNALTVLADNTNRYKLAAGESTTETLSTSTQRTLAWGSSTNAQIGHSATLTFASNAQLRYFFNAGGTLRIYPTYTPPGTPSSQESNWNTLISSINVAPYILTDYTATTTPSGTGSAIGGLDLTTSYQQIMTKAGTGTATAYANNDYTIGLATDATGAQVLVRIVFNDDAKNAALYDTVGGTWNSYITIIRPTGTNVAVTAPTVSTTRNLTTDGTVLTIP